MQNVTTIALTGSAYAGKTTAATYLANHYGVPVLAFATPIKRMLIAMGLSRAQVYGSLKDTPCELLGGKTPRHAMQTLGTEWGRDMICPDVWIRAWDAARRDADGPVISDDCRFSSEAAHIRSIGGVIVYIQRDSPPHHPAGAHVSEAGDGFNPDFTIVNDSGPAEFYVQLRKITDNITLRGFEV